MCLHSRVEGINNANEETYVDWIESVAAGGGLSVPLMTSWAPLYF